MEIFAEPGFIVMLMIGISLFMMDYKKQIVTFFFPELKNINENYKQHKEIQEIQMKDQKKSSAMIAKNNTDNKFCVVKFAQLQGGAKQNKSSIKIPFISLLFLISLLLFAMTNFFNLILIATLASIGILSYMLVNCKVFGFYDSIFILSIIAIYFVSFKFAFVFLAFLIVMTPLKNLLLFEIKECSIPIIRDFCP